MLSDSLPNEVEVVLTSFQFRLDQKDRYIKWLQGIVTGAQEKIEKELIQGLDEFVFRKKKNGKVFAKMAKKKIC